MTVSSNSQAPQRGLENKLGSETSLYLLQHRENPVAWQPWGEDAFASARELNKPILLSIGYSACHWCHVMARESFSDGDAAAMMNELFVNVKVDREERPDIDEVYQTAHQMLTGRPGGWPLTVFLCPKTLLPFIAGTYFPLESAGGQIGFRELLQRVSEFYRQAGDDFTRLRDQVRLGFEGLGGRKISADVAAELSLEVRDRAVMELLKSADTRLGGFGRAPKFAMPSALERLFGAAEKDGELAANARRQLQLTLTRMARGGICDHLNGGFFRYATDDQWMIPHFEKMLYDNGALLSVYAQAWQLFGDAEYERVARGIAQWALSEMCSPEGAFYSSLNADAGEDSAEGGYYLWSRAELQQLLSAEEFALVAEQYGLKHPANFNSRWHLHQSHSWLETIAALRLDTAKALALQTSAVEKLLMARQQKTRPSRDDKILCSWNALMIRGLATAARNFDDADYLVAAQRAIDFIRENLWINNRLFASWQGGAPKLTGYLDDYVFLMDALLELLQTQWRDDDYRLLIAVAESVCHNFEDTRSGGFFFTAHDHEQLIYRSKSYYDNVIPAGNGIAAKVFGRLGHLVAEPRYLTCAERTLRSSWQAVQGQPQSHHNILVALEELHNSPIQVLLRGDGRMAQWQRQLRQHNSEQVHCYWVPEDSEFHPPEVMMLESNYGLICVGSHCLAPQQSLDSLQRQLRQESGAMPVE